MCYVSATELKKNLAHYLSLSAEEDVYVTKNGKVIAALVNPKDRAFRDFFAFQKRIKDKEPEKSYDDALYEEMEERCGF